MREKLSRYYARTEHPFVYADAAILDPYCKLLIFEQPSFADDASCDWKEYYKEECKNRFIRDYRAESTVLADNHLRKRKAIDLEERFENDYHIAVSKAQKKYSTSNEFDNYLHHDVFLTDGQKCDVLGWWRINHPNYPDLAKMFRTSHAVPATGAGVEREFSISGRIVRPDHGRLHHITITQSMFYKDMLARSDKRLLSVPTDPEEDDEDAENPAEYKMLKLLSFRHNFRSSQLSDVDMESDNDEDIYGSGL